MNKKEIATFNTNDFDACLDIIHKYWNTDYGTIDEIDTPDGKFILELTTGGWSENEEIIDKICDTWFWLLWWQESKRGGYYKFIFVNRIMDNESEDKK